MVILSKNAANNTGMANAQSRTFPFAFVTSCFSSTMLFTSSAFAFLSFYLKVSSYIFPAIVLICLTICFGQSLTRYISSLVYFLSTSYFLSTIVFLAAYLSFFLGRWRAHSLPFISPHCSISHVLLRSSTCRSERSPIESN